MTTSQSEMRTPAANPKPAIQRRGLLAAAWAAMAAVVLNRTTQPVEAGVDGDVVLGSYNTANSLTDIDNTNPNDIAFVARCEAGTNGTGLFGVGSGFGVFGENRASGRAGGAGVLGISDRSDSYGVEGQNLTGGTAVFGLSFSGNGVMGQIPSGTSANAIAIYGQNYSSYVGPNPGAGGFGVYGLSAKGHGLVGATATAGGAAVVGASNGVAGAYAGAFYGSVVVSGAFTVVGGPKSAAVPHPDGTHRRLYCVESPESWFEDFGKGQLECGAADVTIDPDFAAVALLDDYHVFLTQYGGMDVLSVTEQTPKGFRVETKDPTSTTRFSWRIVAKRKDIAALRFETVTVPPEPVLPPVPEIVDAPQPPVFPRASVRHAENGRR